MTNKSRRLLLAVGAVVAFSPPVMAESPTFNALYESLARTAPTLNRRVLNKALAAMQCATSSGAEQSERLAVIDFSLPSTAKRLWIFDLQQRRLVLRDLVAHGQKSGENYATRFSNVVGSYRSSLGLFRTQESYFGRHGYALRLDGLEPGVNDRARERAIVIHGADYVDPEWIGRQGRIGRSQGCPAVRPEVVEKVVDNLKGGQFMFAYYPDPEWLAKSAYLNCEPQRVANVVARIRGGNG